MTGFFWTMLTQLWNLPSLMSIKFKLAWYGVKTYTILENNIVKPMYTRLFTPTYSVVFIRQGVEFTKQSVSTTNSMSSTDEYDYALVTYPAPMVDPFNACVKRIAVHNIEADNGQELDPVNCHLSSARMLGAQLIVNRGEYTLNITLGHENYMVIHNRLWDRPFVEWFMLNEHDLVLEQKDHYTVSFINEHMHCVEFSSPHYIVVHDDHLEITQDKQAYASSNSSSASSSSGTSSGTETPVIVDRFQNDSQQLTENVWQWFRFS
jgi:hypothetical protein